MLAAGCSVSDPIVPNRAAKVYKAGVESIISEGNETRVFFDDNLKSHWTAGDHISLFKTTQNEEYKFEGNTGDTSGEFSAVNSGTASGSDLPADYAVYPYNSATTISTAGKISLDMPSVQEYAEGSFGLGANTMVAVTKDKEDALLTFKNVGGYLVLKLYGSGKVKSITLSGNNNEKIAGKASVNITYGGDPSVVMDASATGSITLDCGSGVELSPNSAQAKSFWFVVPPVTFSKGFTFTIKSSDGTTFTKATTKSRAVARNVMNTMEVLKIDFERGLINDSVADGNIVFADPKVKAICVANWDTNTDGEISYAEAAAVSDMESVFQNSKIDSFNELRFFGSIGTGSTFGNSTITSARLPWNLQMTWGTFMGCTSLTDVELPDALLEIGIYTFKGCSKLSSIVVPRNVKKIDSQAFSDCQNLKSITLLPETPPSIQGFDSSVTCDFYVSAASLATYKADAKWSVYSDRIKPIS